MATFKTTIDSSTMAATGSLAIDAGDLKLKASCTALGGDGVFSFGRGSGSPVFGPDATLPVESLSLGIEKPGRFRLDYDVLERSPSFQFQSSATLAGRPIQVMYDHKQKENNTSVGASLAVDHQNMVSFKYRFDSGTGEMKYSYTHAEGDAILEPGFDFGSNTWSFSLWKKLSDEDIVMSKYDGLQKSVTFDWSRRGKDSWAGPFKVSAAIPLSGSKPPKVTVEKSWEY